MVEWDESLANVKISRVHWEGKYATESNNHLDNFYVISLYIFCI